MKKFLFLTLLFVLTITLPAADFSLSTGGGFYLGGHFTRYRISFPIGETVSMSATQDMDQFNIGGYAFFDATWVEFSVGVHTGLNSYNETMTSPYFMLNEGTGQETMLNFTLLGKYPFALNEKFTLFPLAGLEYHVALSQYRQPQGQERKSRTEEYNFDGEKYTLSYFNAMFIDLGAGMDFDLSTSIFFRTELLYNIRLETRQEKDAQKQARAGFGATGDSKLSGLSSGPTLRLGVGYRL